VGKSFRRNVEDREFISTLLKAGQVPSYKNSREMREHIMMEIEEYFRIYTGKKPFEVKYNGYDKRVNPDRVSFFLTTDSDS